MDVLEDNNDNEADYWVFRTPTTGSSRKPLLESVRKEILELGYGFIWFGMGFEVCECGGLLWFFFFFFFFLKAALVDVGLCWWWPLVLLQQWLLVAVVVAVVVVDDDDGRS